VIAAAPEGVYVFDGQGADLLRLCDHTGRYLRTIYPFPAARLKDVQGLARQQVPQLGREMPRKQGYTQATLLTSGGSSIDHLLYSYGNGFAASAMAVRATADGGKAGSRIASVRRDYRAEERIPLGDR
jgi:hypothetical protein